MADHLTEEEQIEALKKWWSDNWMAIVLPVVLVAGGFLANNIYQSQKAGKAQEASAVYEQLVKVIETQATGELSEDDVAKARKIADDIKADFSTTMYANHADLIMAGIEVENQQYDSAASYLKNVADNGVNDAIKALANARLAKVYLAQGKHKDALTLVASTSDKAYQAMYAEIRGDVLAAQGDSVAAQTAYQEAIDNLDGQQFSRRSIIQIKLDGAKALAPATPEAPVAEVVAEPAAEEAAPATEGDAEEAKVAASAEEASEPANTEDKK